MKSYFSLILTILAISILACGGSATPEKVEPTPVAATVEAETPTPVYTSTPVPTPTLVMLTCAEIEREHGERTDLQWETYSREILGEQIRFAGKVLEVYDDGSVQVSDRACKNFFTVVKLYEIPLDVAAELDKDQFVEGEGIVREVDIFLGLTIQIEVIALR